MPRFLFVVSTFLLLVPALSRAEPLRIGVILPLSGEYASLGQYLQNGITLALEEIPVEERGAIQITFENDQLQSTHAVSAFQKLQQGKGQHAYIALGSGIGTVLAPLAEQHKTVLVAVGASAKEFVQGKTYSFTHWVSPETEAQVLVEEIARRGFKRIALATNEQEGALALEDAFIKTLNRFNLSDRLVLTERFLLTERDFRAFITKARIKQVDNFTLILLTQGLIPFATQARAAGVKAQLSGFELFEDESIIKESGGLFSGAWYVNADEPNSDFRFEYRTRFNQEPGWGAANSYDTVRLLIEAYKKVGANSKEIADWLRQLKNYTGAVGVYSATGDNRFELPAALKEVTPEGFRKMRPTIN